MDPNIMLEIVENIMEAADELMKKEDRNPVEFGELIAYAESLCIIQDSLTGYDLSVIGLDFDVDECYLYPLKVDCGHSPKRKIEALSRKRRLHNRLGMFYEKIFVHDEECFRMNNGEIFKLDKFLGKHALVVEYAENYQEALLNRFEDGDLFYLDEMNEEEMFQAIMNEIAG